MTDAKIVTEAGFQQDDSFFNQATSEQFYLAADQLIALSRIFIHGNRDNHTALCLGAVALAGIAQMRRRKYR